MVGRVVVSGVVVAVTYTSSPAFSASAIFGSWVRDTMSIISSTSRSFKLILLFANPQYVHHLLLMLFTCDVYPTTQPNNFIMVRFPTWNFQPVDETMKFGLSLLMAEPHM